MTKDELLELADRCEREEASRELDCAVAKVAGWSFNNRHAIFCWRDPGGEYRTDFPLYTTSLDAHVRPAGEDVFWRSGHDGEGPDPSLFKAEVLVVRDNGSRSSFGIARTEAMARRAAELRARASTPTQGEGQ